jgi:LPS-assembly protein
MMAGSIPARPSCGLRRALVLAATALACWLGVRPTAAADAAADNNKGPALSTEWVGIPKQQTRQQEYSVAKPDPNAQMLVQATEIHYDYSNERISAVGSVQIYYNGATLEADKVTYDQKTKRLKAEGNVRLVEADGKIVYGEILDLDDQFRDGFVDSLRLETPDKIRFASPLTQRSGGNYTVFQSGVYTACEPCKDDPRKPPKWQVKAVRIIHDEMEKMIYFENARLEVFGVPLLWVPYFSTADPTVKRKSGWLTPSASFSRNYGVGFSAPYYWALAPNYDFTLTPTLTSVQGPLLEGQWRQRFDNGAFSIHGAGIVQADPHHLTELHGPGYPGDRRFRGEVDTVGQFSLNDKWVLGWDALLLSDKTLFQDYKINSYWQHFNDPKYFGNGITDAGNSQLYFIGRGDRSYFDARVMYFYGLSLADHQSQLPIVHPVVDYARTFAQPVLGGELSLKANLTSLSRETADFDAISQAAITANSCMTADPAIRIPANCLLRGIPGTYSRASAETTWRRTLVDPFGQTWTPFVILRGDVGESSISNQPGVANFVQTGDNTFARFMPAVGLEYRYPLISVQSWGTQTIEPIVQVIARPNETDSKIPNEKIPNEDSQSLIFDDSNLFKVDKFAGWDRVEGGGRANYGLQYTAQFNQAGTVNALFGQSVQLFGKNSFAFRDAANTGVDSGLETTRSDYVARLSYQPDRTYTFISRFRFDDQNFSVQRAELEGRANFDRWAVAMLYGNYAPQPDIGFLTRRDGLLGSVSFKMTPNWSVIGAARYDLGSAQFDQYRLGLGYIDDCFAISVNYITDFNYGFSPTNTNSIAVGTDHMVTLQISLRTLGSTGFSTRVAGPATN